MSANPVRDDEVLYRRVTPEQIIKGTITSAAFRSRGHEDGCSTQSASHVSIEDCLRDFPGRGLISVTGADVVASGGGAVRDPKEPAHVLIVGKGYRFQKELATRAKLLVAPAPPPETSTSAP